MESIGDLGTSLLLQHVVSSGSSQIFPMTRQSKFFFPKVIQKYIDTFTKVESKPVLNLVHILSTVKTAYNDHPRET